MKNFFSHPNEVFAAVIGLLIGFILTFSFAVAVNQREQQKNRTQIEKQKTTDLIVKQDIKITINLQTRN